ncbi:uncharacterized protein LOC120208145 [Hibiscus syriacus]|uniref:uncharacterized protein LOC120208145 n=1 Tax=Hibiscus syriacus TaxID=106335 RepID=UPI001920EF7A|nr:uncharacterized protein LOC120208145 [Hibiscus syriacus]
MPKEIEDNLARIEREHKDMQEEMKNKLAQLEANIANSQLDLLNKVEEMFRRHLITGKTTVEDPIHPLGFTPVHIPKHISAHQGIRSPPGEHCVNIEVPDQNELAENEEIIQRMKDIEEMVKSKEMVNAFYGSDARDLSLVPDLILPPKFKAPDFEKYNGSTCPSAHLIMFCMRMTGYTENDKLLIHWWTLQNMEKRHNETFRQYAQRWHDVASQVQPPLLENETTIIFVNTLKDPYLGHLVGNATKNFADLFISRELIENAIRNGKIRGSDSTDVKKGADVNTVHGHSKDDRAF